MKPIRILITDDHNMVRQGLKALLELSLPDAEFFEASTGLEALEKLETVRPNVMLLDLVLPGLDGLEVAKICRRRWPETKIVAVSIHSNEAYVCKALEAGASGYVLKSCDASRLADAVQSVLNGSQYLSPPLCATKIREISTQTDGGRKDLYETLTRREKQILQLTTEGLTNVRMAEQLGISPRTVEVHRANLMKKLGVGNHSQLVRFSLSRGMIPGDDLPPPASFSRMPTGSVPQEMRL